MMAALALSFSAHCRLPRACPSTDDVKRAMYRRYEDEAMAGRQRMQAAYPDQVISVHVVKIGKLRRLRCEPDTPGALVRCSFEARYRNRTDRFDAALKHEDDGWTITELSPVTPKR